MGVMSRYPAMSEVVVGSTRRELKHLSTSRKRNQARDTLSSGERKGYSLNRATQVAPGLRDLDMRLSFITERSGKVGQSG